MTAADETAHGMFMIAYLNYICASYSMRHEMFALRAGTSHSFPNENQQFWAFCFWNSSFVSKIICLLKTKSWQQYIMSILISVITFIYLFEDNSLLHDSTQPQSYLLYNMQHNILSFHPFIDLSCLDPKQWILIMYYPVDKKVFFFNATANVSPPPLSGLYWKVEM